MPAKPLTRRLCQLSNTQRERIETLALVLGIAALSLAFRVTETDAMVNVDMFHLWSKRIVRFFGSLESGELAGTYQSHHPGVLFMWMAGSLWKSQGVLSGPLDPHKLRLAVLPVAAIGSLFPASTYLLMKRGLGREHRVVAFLTAALFATEPLFVAHSRNAHLDMLVTAFAWSAVLAAFIARRELSLQWGAFGGMLLGLALLTKLSSAGIALGIVAMFLGRFGDASNDLRRVLRVLAAVVIAATLIVVVLWPALWVAPIETLTKLRTGLDHEVNKTAEFMLFGDTGKLRLPIWIYGLFLIHLVTPEFWVPAMMGGCFAFGKNVRIRAFISSIVVATLPLVLLLALSKLIGTRYLIPTLPMFGTLTAIGVVRGAAKVQYSLGPRWRTPLAALLVLALITARCLRLAALHPLPITYCSSWTGVDCAEVFHIGWGEGLKEASSIVAQQAKLRGYVEPPVVYGSGYASTMRLWTPVSTTSAVEDAQLLVDYLPDRLRRITSSTVIAEQVRLGGLLPVGEVKIQGRTYVRVFAGPRY
jgi:hypothetical protein